MLDSVILDKIYSTIVGVLVPMIDDIYDDYVFTSIENTNGIYESKQYEYIRKVPKRRAELAVCEEKLREISKQMIELLETS